MNIVIKNVTDEPVNEGLILELSKAEFPSGSIVRYVQYFPERNCCEWSSGANNCCAYLGETCIELPKISGVHISSLRDGGYTIDALINGKKVGPKNLPCEDVMSLSDKTDRNALAAKILIADDYFN